MTFPRPRGTAVGAFAVVLACVVASPAADAHPRLGESPTESVTVVTSHPGSGRPHHGSLPWTDRGREPASDGSGGTDGDGTGGIYDAATDEPHTRRGARGGASSA